MQTDCRVCFYIGDPVSTAVVRLCGCAGRTQTRQRTENWFRSSPVHKYPELNSEAPNLRSHVSIVVLLQLIRGQGVSKLVLSERWSHAIYIYKVKSKD